MPAERSFSATRSRVRRPAPRCRDSFSCRCIAPLSSSRVNDSARSRSAIAVSAPLSWWSGVHHTRHAPPGVAGLPCAPAHRQAHLPPGHLCFSQAIAGASLRVKFVPVLLAHHGKGLLIEFLASLLIQLSVSACRKSSSSTQLVFTWATLQRLHFHLGFLSACRRALAHARRERPHPCQ